MLLWFEKSPFLLLLFSLFRASKTNKEVGNQREWKTSFTRLLKKIPTKASPEIASSYADEGVTSTRHPTVRQLNIMNLQIHVVVSVLLLSHIASAWWHRDTCAADQEEPWSYHGLNGPEHWGESYPQCNGLLQSPIALDEETSYWDESLRALRLTNFEIPVTQARLENTGETAMVTPQDGVRRSLQVNGSDFSLRQLHFHWGPRHQGSEHALDGRRYDLEGHFVFGRGNDIAVLGVLFNLGVISNKGLSPIVDQLQKTPYKGQATVLKKKLKLESLLPRDLASYYRYLGSLTTPPCTEGVIWTVLDHVQRVSYDQMKAFRRLYSARKDQATEDCHMTSNTRPLQDANGRTVLRP